jgi:hypothetical protein
MGNPGYIVFEDLPLDEFGNRIPPITAEVSWNGAPQAVVKDTTFLPDAGYFTGSAVLDSERGFLYYKTSPDGIGRIRTSGMVEDLRVPATELGIDLTGVKAIDSRGDLYVTHGITEQSFRKILSHLRLRCFRRKVPCYGWTRSVLTKNKLAVGGLREIADKALNSSLKLRARFG